MQKSEIKFVRIRGRIVPIKKKKEDAGSAALIAAGVLTSVGGGILAGNKVKRAEKMHQHSFDFMNEKRNSLPKGITSIGHGFEKAQMSKKFAKRTMKASNFLGTMLIGAGVSGAINRHYGQPETDIEEGARYAASLASGELANRSLAAGFKNRGNILAPFKKIKMPNAAKRVLKDLGARFIKRQLKMKGI